MVPLGVTVANIAVGYIVNSINLCIAFIDRHDIKKGVKDSCLGLKRELSSCQEKANDINEYISRHRIKEIWQPTVEEINDSLESIDSRLVMLLTDDKLGNNLIAKSRRKFRQPQDMEKKLNGFINEVRHIDGKIFNFQLNNNAHAEANATNDPQADDPDISKLRTSSVRSNSPNVLRPVTYVTQTPSEAMTLDASTQHTSSTETTTAFCLVSDLARGCKDLIVYSSRALIAVADGALIRVQEALVARAIADCSQSLGLLGNKKWYFCGGDVLPEFALKVAMANQPDAARRKIVDMLMSLSSFGLPEINLVVRSKEKWDAATLMDVSFVNALIFKRYYGLKWSNAQGKAGIANEINSELNVSASDMLLVLQALRCKSFVDQGLVVVSNGEQGLGWYRVLFLDDDRVGRENETSAFRLEYVRGLENSGSGSYCPADAKDIMILNFLHVYAISPRARHLTEEAWRGRSWMQTGLGHEGNMYEGHKAMFDAINIEGHEYTELLEIACLYTFRAGFYARCQSFVDTLVNRVDQRQMVVWTARSSRHMHLRQGREVSFARLASDFCEGILEDAKERNVLASCDDLYEYGRFCTQEEVMYSWYNLLVLTIVHSVDVSFAQAALTGRGSYTKYVANNKCVRLKDSILLCDQASDSVAVAFDAVSEMSSSLKLQITELVNTTESQRLRAAFFICRGAIRARRDISTRMLDVMRIRYMGLQGIENISVQDMVEDLDEGERRNPAVVVECMESLAMQGGYRENASEKSLFTALCSYRRCEKTMLVSGNWPPLLGEFNIFRRLLDDWVEIELEHSSKFLIFASKQGNICRALKIGPSPYKAPEYEIPGTLEELVRSNEFISVY